MERKTPILLVGAGGHARSCIDVIESDGRYTVFGLIGTSLEMGQKILGKKVLGVDADLPRLRDNCSEALIAVGQIKNWLLRYQIFQRLMEYGYHLPVVISAKAHVSSYAQIGKGTIVMHGAVVNAGARIGHNCIINNLSLIEHDAIIGDHCHISTGAVVNGSARIGDGTFIGSGSVLKESIQIGSRCLVGMGLAVRHHVPDDTQFLA